jgi:hypothetical protein
MLSLPSAMISMLSLSTVISMLSLPCLLTHTFFSGVGEIDGVVRDIHYDDDNLVWYYVEYSDGDTEQMRLHTLQSILVQKNNHKMDQKTASCDLSRFQRDVRAYIRTNVSTRHNSAEKKTVSIDDLKSDFESKMGYGIGKYSMWFAKMIRSTFKVVNPSHKVYSKTGLSLMIY